jgi:hypothetical protein
MRLDRVEVAAGDADGVFHVASQAPVRLHRGQQLKVRLYWQALAAPNAERTISVRIVDRAGIPLVLYDNMPGQGKKPTTWWQTGWQIRDTYTLTLPPDAPAGPASLVVMVYDSYSREVVPFDGGTELLDICAIDIVP